MLDNFSKNKEAVLEALLISCSIKEAAIQANLTEQTIYRYLKDPDFSEQLASRRRQLANIALAGIQGRIESAVSRLDKLLNAESESVQLQAARTIMEYSIKIAEVQDLESRIAALEKKITK